MMEKIFIFSFLFLLLFSLNSMPKAYTAPTSASLPVSRLYTLKDSEIKGSDLGKVNVGDNLQIKEVFLDESGNKITNISLTTDDLGIFFEPVFKAREKSYSNKELLQNNGEYIIVLNSTLAGKFKLTGKYFSQEIYYVTFVPGNASKNSILEVDKNVVNAGEKVTVFIIPYDKYENLINASIYQNNSNPFIVSYNNGKSNQNVKVEEHEIVNIIKYQLISYNIFLKEAGEITISGKIGDDTLNSRIVVVNPLEMDFQQSIIKRYYSNNTEKDLFNGINENIYETELIYRLYPKDKYGNTIEFIPETKLANFRSYLEYSNHNNLFYNLRLKNEKYDGQHYAEFAIDDAGNKVSYMNLIYGDYNLFFNDGNEHILFKIILNNGCYFDKPFKCSFWNIKCVSSQTDCKCPTGYGKCSYMPYCVPNGNRDMCPRIGTKNKRVCPIGKVLCADLSCKDKYDDCYVYSDCPLNSRRCPDQSCAYNVDDCPNSITCEKSTDYICNNTKCVESELDCV